MNNPLLKKILPHVIALVLFLIVSILFCKPALDGNVLNQHDTIGWKGMAQNSFEYKEKTGHFPLWNPNLFSGMPNYQVAMQGKSVMPDMIKVFTLGLPKPINFFFLACICFYILCLVLRINPVIGMLSSLAFSFSTYNPVIVAAGHDTQMLATALMPLLLAGIISLYEKKYWLGFALTTYAAYQQIGVGHLQVTYYLFLVVLLVTIGYLVKWILAKDWKHIFIAGGLAVVAGLIGIAGNALILKTTSEYSKFTMRGGKDVSVEGDTVKAANTSGLDTAYAFEYSLGKKESATIILPNAFGGASSNYSDESSQVVKKLVNKGVSENEAMQIAASTPAYWGELYTSGPAYLGVLIVLFGLIGFVLVKKPMRWGLLAVTILGIFMSWGKYLPGFNTFLFEHLPLYNKFRSPPFSQVIPQFTIGIMAALAFHQLLFADKSREMLATDFKKILYTAGGLFGLLALMYLAMDYSTSIDKQIIAGYTDPKNGSDEMGRLIVSGLKADRKAMFGGQLLRAAGIAVLGIGILWLFAKSKISALVAAIILLLISTLDITIVSKPYLADDQYISADELAGANFTPNNIEQQIMQDKDPNFRVFNMVGIPSAGPFSESRTSYFFKSVGGYHPAKLRIYNDVIEKYLSGRPSPRVLNMLNAKYIIVQDPQNGQAGLITNPDVFGNCWLVKNVQLVNDRVASLTSLGITNLKDTAIVEKSLIPNLVQPQWDSASYIKMTKFDNDAIEYEADCKGPQFAVFSEVFYPKGWNAYLDEKKTVYYNTNYVLRGMPLPAGKHTIRFVFEPESVKQGISIMFISSILVLVILVGGLFMAWKTGRNQVGKAGVNKA